MKKDHLTAAALLLVLLSLTACDAAVKNPDTDTSGTSETAAEASPEEVTRDVAIVDTVLPAKSEPEEPPVIGM